MRKKALRITSVIALLVASVLARDTAAQQNEQQSDTMKRIAALGWQVGPGTGDLGGMASLTIPKGYRFLDRRDAGKFMELNQNPISGQELGVLLADSYWFVVFEFSPEGYVKDDDRNLDADALLATIRESTAAANKVRQDRGWSTLEVAGWQQKPYYDPKTNNLTWAIRGKSEGSTTINHSTRLLGRRGVMRVELVISPEQIEEGVPAFNSVLGGFSFAPGQQYAAFTKGDKVAEYGLTGLIAGGVGVALLKTGLLQKLWKFIVIGVLAIIGAIRRFFNGLRRRPQSPAEPGNV